MVPPGPVYPRRQDLQSGEFKERATQGLWGKLDGPTTLEVRL